MDLSRREKVFLGSGAAFVGLFVVIVFMIVPFMHYRADLERDLVAQDARLRTVYDLAARIQASDTRKRPLARDDQPTLFGFLEQLASELEINDRIEYMKPIGDANGAGHESVEVKIKGVYEEDLIGLLFGIQSSPRAVRIRRLNIRRVGRERNLDLTFQVVLYG